MPPTRCWLLGMRHPRVALGATNSFDLTKWQICGNPNADASRDFASGHGQEKLDKQEAFTNDFSNWREGGLVDSFLIKDREVA